MNSFFFQNKKIVVRSATIIEVKLHQAERFGKINSETMCCLASEAVAVTKYGSLVCNIDSKMSWPSL